ncbi:MAG: tetratricopeptide repeat protein [Actinomycetota bacterium]|nr:tetratricopeptide repeat protein [Actinomycetota bacterium]
MHPTPQSVGSATDTDLEELRSRLLRYPVAQYPVQHAVTRFHLGVRLLQVGRAAEALPALDAAAAGFTAVGLALELAKAVNMRGVALREVGDLHAAAEAFAVAATGFAELGQPLEEAAASYNLGLVRRLLGDSDQARSGLLRAMQLFGAANLPVQEAAAARELGTLLLTDGHPEEAVTVLTTAVSRARDGGDAAGTGAAANTLGLAYLAGGTVLDAVGAFRTAAGAHPRSVRPAEHAMAKANLALAYERQAAPARARLAAGQALAVSDVPAAVRDQAEAVLGRLPPATGAELFDVLEDEPPEGWPVVLREEVTRWAECRPAERAEAAGSWVEGVVLRSGRGPELTEALLNAVLELPPAAYERIVEALVRATSRQPDTAADRFRAVTRSGMARFPVPQWQRLAATFERAAERSGNPAGWT